MTSNDVFALAAHMHVLLRRKAGRLTDTEWLTTNADCAWEIVRFTREKAAGHARAAKPRTRATSAESVRPRT